jgi:hypothetical protein
MGDADRRNGQTQPFMNFGDADRRSGDPQPFVKRSTPFRLAHRL